jgi:hypothetical protein
VLCRDVLNGCRSTLCIGCRPWVVPIALVVLTRDMDLCPDTGNVANEFRVLYLMKNGGKHHPNKTPLLCSLSSTKKNTYHSLIAQILERGGKSLCSGTRESTVGASSSWSDIPSFASVWKMGTMVRSSGALLEPLTNQQICSARISTTSSTPDFPPVMVRVGCLEKNCWHHFPPRSGRDEGDDQKVLQVM